MSGNEGNKGEKINQQKKEVHLHISQILLQAWLEKWDAQFSSTLHTAKAVETEK